MVWMFIFGSVYASSLRKRSSKIVSMSKHNDQPKSCNAFTNNKQERTSAKLKKEERGLMKNKEDKGQRW